MINMDHCRFQNTLEALQECERHRGDASINPAEQIAKRELIALCHYIAKDTHVYEGPPSALETLMDDVSELPWSAEAFGESLLIMNAQFQVCRMADNAYYLKANANATIIAHAVNMLMKLVKALQLMLHEAQHLHSSDVKPGECSPGVALAEVVLAEVLNPKGVR